LKVAFDDSLSGIFAVEPERRGDVFPKLLDPKIFNAITINPDFGCVERLGGIDLCPDVMHRAVTGSGSEKERPLAAVCARMRSRQASPLANGNLRPESPFTIPRRDCHGHFSTPDATYTPNQ
jgi:hypothetical protein